MNARRRWLGWVVGLSKANSFASMKVLSCVFFHDVLCSYRKNVKFGVMGRCFKCRHYRRFMREMTEEDMKLMDKIDEMRRFSPELE